MVVERFKEGRVAEVYQRFATRGRLMPDGLRFIESWISADVRVCYQLMEADDAALLEQWTSNWSDLVDFEINPIITSEEARARVLALFYRRPDDVIARFYGARLTAFDHVRLLAGRPPVPVTRALAHLWE